MKYEERIKPKQPNQAHNIPYIFSLALPPSLSSTIFYAMYEVLVSALVYCIHILSIDIWVVWWSIVYLDVCVCACVLLCVCVAGVFWLAGWLVRCWFGWLTVCLNCNVNKIYYS